MTSPPLTLPLIIPFLYSSLQFFSTSSLLPLSPHRSQDQPPHMTSPPLTLTLYIPFLCSLSMPTIWYCCNSAAQLPLGFQLVTRPTTHMTSPLLTLQLYTFSLPPLYSIHPLSTSPLYILNIVRYCHSTIQSLLGSRPVTRQLYV